VWFAPGSVADCRLAATVGWFEIITPESRLVVEGSVDYLLRILGRPFNFVRRDEWFGEPKDLDPIL